MKHSDQNSRWPILLFAAALFVSLPLVLGFMGGLHPAFDTLSHLRAHLAAMMGLLALPLLFSSLRREAAMLLVFALMAFSTTLGAAQNLLRGAQAPPAIERSGPYRLMQINLRYDNDDPKKLLQLVGRERPDIITYQEAGDHWTDWLNILENTYPYRLHCRKDPGKWGVGILSRRPFADHSNTVCVGDGLLAIAPINLGGTNVTVAALHLSWPWPGAQARQLDHIVPALQQLSGPTLIAGDLNVTPWSHTTRLIERASGTQHQSGIGPTWLIKPLPVTLAPAIGLPIDQIFISDDIQTEKIGTGADIGSDHLPVQFEFKVPSPPGEPEQPQTDAVVTTQFQS